MTIAYKIQPYHVLVSMRDARDENLHASFNDRDCAINWGIHFSNDALVGRIDIECVRAGTRTHVRSWTPKAGWHATSYEGDPTKWLD